ncbi:MAG: MoaD/ThiS family protein [Flavobacteriales bacterium]|nr:MoaD/ThiS family protein [Flavobacteriales bacterium]
MEVLAFGIARDIIGKSNFTLSDPTIKTVEDFRNYFYQKYPDLLKLNSLAIAVNEQYAHNDFLLNDFDEIALIPPVSGG